MNKPYKFSSKIHKLLWISDMHQNHDPKGWDTPSLWQTRGFSSITEHDAWLRAKWSEICQPTEADPRPVVIFNLGDTMFGDPKGEKFRQFTLWSGQILALSGNHFSGFRQIYREAAKARFPDIKDNENIYPLTYNNVTFVGDYIHAYIDGISVFMQHYASYVWPEIGSGSFCLVGHSHRTCKELNPEYLDGGKILDTGLDNAIFYNQTPFFSWPEIQKIMARKKTRTVDHHDGRKQADP